MLLHTPLHDPPPLLPANSLLNLRKQKPLFHLVVPVQDFGPTFCVCNKIFYIPSRGDAWGLEVDCVEAADWGMLVCGLGIGRERGEGEKETH